MARTRSLARVPSAVRAPAPARRSEERARTPSPDADLAVRVQALVGNDVVEDAVGPAPGLLAQLVQENLALTIAGVDPAAGSFSGSNQAMLRAMRAVREADEGGAAGEAAVSQALRRSGRPLPAPLQARLEAHFGVALDAVRVHDDAAAAAASEGIAARAFSTGTHVFFGRGELRPETPGGLELLAHEVTHVVQHLQQRAGRPTAVEDGVPVTLPGDAVEREAEAEARAFARGAPAIDADAAPPPDAGWDAFHEVDVAPAAALDAGDAAWDAEVEATSSAPAAGGDLFARTGGSLPVSGPSANATDAQNAARVLGPNSGQSQSGGWTLEQGPNGRVWVRQAPTRQEGVTTKNDSFAGVKAEGEASTQVGSASTTVSGSGGTLEASGTVLGASANGVARIGASTEGYEIKAEGGVKLTLAGGKLKYTTPNCEFAVLGEALKAECTVELTADVCAELKGSLLLALTAAGDGVALKGGGTAFAGAKAGVKGGIALHWKPKGVPDFLIVAGAFAGVEGWAGAAAAFDGAVSLYPSLKAEFNYGVALGFGAGVSYGVEVQVVHTAMLMLTLAGRGAALALDAIGMEYLAQALNEIVDSFWDDDAARAAVAAGVHKNITVDERIKLVNRMLSGACLDEDEQAILTILRDANGSGEISALAKGCEGGILALVDKFDGQEHSDLLALLYTQANIRDIPIDDGVARKLVELGLHPNMPMEDVRRTIEALLDGFTGDDDEQAILRIVRERPDFKTVLTQDLKERTLENFHGEEYDALAGFLFLQDMLADVDIDDDVSRAVINQKMHLAVDDAAKLKRLLDELISGATGDDDEACIVRLLLDKPAFTQSLSQSDLDACLEDVDGEEYEDLLVALRKGRRIVLTSDAYDVDDNVARRLVAQGVHTDLSNEEARRVVNELVDGVTGDDDEAAILRILVDNATRAAQILDTQDLRQTVLDNCHGDESDALIGVYAIYDLMPGLEIDDDVARGIVRLGLHTRVTDGQVLVRMIDALIDGFTGDDDEAALIAICKECPPVRPLLTADKMATILDNVNGEEHATLLAWARQEGVVPDVSPATVAVDDDDARALVDRVDNTKFTAAEIDRLLAEMNAGFTGDEDEARILKILRARPDALATLTDARVREVIENVDGEELTQLFVFLYENNKVPTNPLPDKFDDDAARAFVDRGFHRDAAKLDAATCVAMLDCMIAGFTGDDDEARVLTLLTDRASDVLAGMAQDKIDEVLGEMHGEEESKLFVLLQRQRKLTLPHDEFDDDAARLFVAERLHTSMEAGQLVHLVDAMTAGGTFDDDEQSLLTLFKDRADVLDQLGNEKVRTILAAFDGAEWDALVVYLYKVGKGGIDIADPTFDRLDDETARLFVQEGLHTRMSAAEIERILRELCEGACGDDDEDAILRILREAWSTADGALDAALVNVLLAGMDGEQYERLLGILWEHGKLPAGYTLDDDVARGLVREGKHKGSATAARVTELLDAMLSGFTGDDDEKLVLQLLTDRADVLAALSTDKVAEIYDNFHGAEESELLVLLLGAGKISLDDERVDDDAARALVAKGKHRDLPAADVAKLVRKLLDGATGGEDEEAIVKIVEDRKADLATVLAGTTAEELIGNFSGEPYKKLVKTLLGANWQRDALLDAHVTADCAYWLVYNGGLTGLTAQQKAKLVTVLAKAPSTDSGRAIVTLMDGDTSNVPLYWTADLKRMLIVMPAEVQGEILLLVVRHDATHRDEALERALPVPARRLVRGFVYQDALNDRQRAVLIQRVMADSGDGPQSAYEVLDWVKRNQPGRFDALVQELGGADKVKEKFTGGMRADVERLLAPAGST